MRERVWPAVTGFAGAVLVVSLFLRWAWLPTVSPAGAAGQFPGTSQNAWDAHTAMAIALAAAGGLGLSVAASVRRERHVVIGLRAGAALALALIGAALAIYHAFDDGYPRGSGPGTVIGFAAAIVIIDGCLRVVSSLRGSSSSSQ